ncbi:MAG: hypothetical protein M3Y91_04600 [Actinomycetota bacterium]|nr:hypothetical protein [Actinomycetota bacterium]
MPSIDWGSMVGTTVAALTGWYVGFFVAAIVIVIVVVLVAIILRVARKIAIQARVVTLALEDCRVNTLPLWDIQAVNAGVTDINRSAAAARGLLGG